MRHTFADIIAYSSAEETLYPGEVLGSGTVGGGCGNELGRFMKHGDVIELEVSGIGVLRNTHRRAARARAAGDADQDPLIRRSRGAASRRGAQTGSGRSRRPLARR